jgi:hypothetical protein
VINTKQYSEPNLKDGQCHTISDSKVYLKDLKTHTNSSSYSQSVNEIGLDTLNQLENTATESYFFCKLKCNLNAQNHFIWITQKDLNENTKNLNGFVCAGLEIRDIAVSSTLTIKTTVATPYLAVHSSYPEVHNRLKSISYKLSPSAASDLYVEFYANLHQIQKAYSYANSPAFQEASAELLKYSPENPESQILVKEKAKQVLETLLQQPNTPLDFTKSDSLITLFFKMNGRFLPYVD